MITNNKTNNEKLRHAFTYTNTDTRTKHVQAHIYVQTHKSTIHTCMHVHIGKGSKGKQNIWNKMQMK